MNITSKEKKILIFLAICLIPVIYLYLFYIPTNRDITVINTEIAKYNSEYKQNLEYMTKLQSLNSEIKILMEKQRNLWALLPPYLKYDEVLLLIKGISDKSKVTISTISFDSLQPVEGTAGNVKGGKSTGAKDKKPAAGKDGKPATGSKTSGSQKKDGKQEQKEVSTKTDDINLANAFNLYGIGGQQTEEQTVLKNGKGYIMNIRMSASCTYSQLKAFISEAKSKKNKIEFNEITASGSPKGILIVDMVMSFYGILDTRNAKNFSLLTDDNINAIPGANKPDIFKSMGQKELQALKKAEETASKNNRFDGGKDTSAYDFSIRLMPYGNDTSPPALTIVAKDIIAGFNMGTVPVIYGDGNRSILTEFDFQEVGGKYLVKFRTDQDAYPEETFKNSANFKLAGDEIRILVDSTPRKFSEDFAAVSLKIKNTTKKNVVVTVTNDDKNKPRVKLVNTSKNVRLEAR